MANLSKRKLERIAVNAINNEADNQDSFLVSNIPVGDKGVSFDGDIEVYKDDPESVGSLIGKVPVQVKKHKQRVLQLRPLNETSLDIVCTEIH